MKLRLIFRPAVLFAVPLIFSIFVWALPGTGEYLRGFDRRSNLDLGAILVLGGWYLLCFLIILIGGAIGRTIAPAPSLELAQTRPGFEKRFYVVLTVIAAIGVIGAYQLILGQVSIVQAVSSGQANELSAVLLDGSSIATLRYAAIVAAPVGVFLAMTKKASWFLAAVNVLLLLAVVLLSSRLSLIMAIAILLFLYVHERPAARLRLVPAAVAAVVLFGVLAVFNYSRNSNFYRLFGVDNPLAMNLYQIEAYVGSPSQVAIGVAHAIFNGKFSVDVGLGPAAQSIVPSFLQAVKGNRSAVTDVGLYGYQVDIAPNLNSNSAFADTYAHYGWWGLLLTALVLFTAAVLYSHLAQYKGVLSVGSAALGYGFLEYWRTFFFNQGPMVFILVALLIAVVIARAMTPVGPLPRTRPIPGTSRRGRDVVPHFVSPVIEVAPTSERQK
jgi:oligosaccharide repeat unit polymerase